MTGKLSKTARASLGKRTTDGFKASGDLSWIVSLNNGVHAYIRDPRNGFTHHVKRGSEQWETIVTELLEHPEFKDKFQADLNELGG